MKREIHIVGAGISGLILGVELLKLGHSVSLYEKTSSAGGLVKTININGYPIDAGPHLYHTVHKEILGYWKSLLGDSLIKKDFYAGNFVDGNIYDYPINKSTLEKQYHASELSKIYEELNNCDETQLSQANNYYDYVRILAGPTLAEKFFTNYPKKLWGIDTKNLSARFAPKRIEIRSERRPFHSGGGKFAGIIDGGCGELPNTLKNEFEKLGGKLFFNHELIGLKKTQNTITGLKFNKLKNIRTENSLVVLTIPINTISNLLGMKTTLYYRSCFCINFLLEGKDPLPDDYDWLYFPNEEVPFHRAGMQTRFSRKGFKENEHLLCCEISYTNKPDQSTINKWIEISSKYLEENNFVPNENIKDIITLDLGPLYPGYFAGHETELKRINSIINSFQNLYPLGSLAEYAYADLQVLTAKSIDMAESISSNIGTNSDVGTVIKYSASKVVNFGEIEISKSSQVFTIAEIGLNHNGSVDACKKLIDNASKAGFSSVKLQTYQTGRISRKTKAARYFEETLDQEESLPALLDRIIFSLEELREIFEYANKKDILIFSTPFDNHSTALLEKLNVPGYKISSMDLNNIPLIDNVSKLQKPMILSTGMASIGEIEEAINVCLGNGNDKLIVLHCVSSYPCDIKTSNLSRIKKISDTFNVLSGFSDHTEEIETPAFAVVAGANVIEKHITLDKNLDGPDHQFSIEPKDYSKMLNLVNDARASISEQPISTNIERKAKETLRRSVYTTKKIKIGDHIDESCITIRSPGDGLDPKYFHLIKDKIAIKNIEEDAPLNWEHLISE